jgi:transposase-like protein
MGKKGKACHCCSHRERSAIDLALARGVSITALSRRYGISTDAIYRHRKAHLPAQLRARLIAGPDLDIDLDRLRETESQSLLANLVALRHRLFAALDVAEEAGDSAMVARVTHQLHENLQITGRLLGDLGVGSITQNILIQPQYVELRFAIVGALRAFPAAAQAVAEVLHRLEDKAATAITIDAERPLFEGVPKTPSAPEKRATDDPTASSIAENSEDDAA